MRGPGNKASHLAWGGARVPDPSVTWTPLTPKATAGAGQGSSGLPDVSLSSKCDRSPACRVTPCHPSSSSRTSARVDPPSIRTHVRDGAAAARTPTDASRPTPPTSTQHARSVSADAPPLPATTIDGGYPPRLSARRSAWSKSRSATKKLTCMALRHDSTADIHCFANHASLASELRKGSSHAVLSLKC